jgi:predicted DCC family thiol-disulfide oxidoreductase YuxK
MIPIDMRRDPTEWLLLYDADCGFCRSALAAVLKADRHRRLRPVELQSADAESVLADLGQEERMSSWHLVAPDGRRWSGGYAAPSLFRLLPGGRLPAALLGADPGLTDRAYRWVAGHRSTLGALIPDRAKERADRLIAERQP